MKKALVLLVVALVSSLAGNVVLLLLMAKPAPNPEQNPGSASEKGGRAEEPTKPTDAGQAGKKDSPKVVTETPLKEIALEFTVYKGKPFSFWVKQLEDRDSSFRREAVNAMAEIAAADRRFAPNVITLLKHKDQGVREACEEALKSLAQKERAVPCENDVPLLVTILGEDQEDVQLRAFRVLVAMKLKAESAIPALAKCRAKYKKPFVDPHDWMEGDVGRLTELKEAEFERVAKMLPMGAFTWHKSKTDDYKYIFSVQFSEDFTDDHVKLIPKWSDVCFVYINSKQVTDASLTELAKLKNLANLQLGSPRITDAGMKELAKLTNLTECRMTCPKVTDAGLKELTTLKNLRILALDCPSVTEAGLSELRKALPNATIQN